jgi:hypothetical protein
MNFERNAANFLSGFLVSICNFRDFLDTENWLMSLSKIFSARRKLRINKLVLNSSNMTSILNYLLLLKEKVELHVLTLEKLSLRIEKQKSIIRTILRYFNNEKIELHFFEWQIYDFTFADLSMIKLKKLYFEDCHISIYGFRHLPSIKIESLSAYNCTIRSHNLDYVNQINKLCFDSCISDDYANFNELKSISPDFLDLKLSSSLTRLKLKGVYLPLYFHPGETWYEQLCELNNLKHLEIYNTSPESNINIIKYLPTI